MTGFAKITNALILALALAVFSSAVDAAETPVADAAMAGDIDAVSRLVRAGADAGSAQGDGMTALHWAAENGDVSLGEVLIYAGANVDAGTRIGRYTPLHIAAREGHSGMVGLLLKAGADPSARTANSGATPLHLAAASGNGKIVTALIKARADVNAREDAWGQTPLIFAASAGRVDAIRILLRAGADVAVTTWVMDVVVQEKADRAAEKRLSGFLAEFKKKEGGGNDWQPSPSQVQAAIQGAREVQRNWPDVPDPKDDPKPEEAKPDEDAKSDDGDGDAEPEKLGAKESDDVAPEPTTYNADGEPVYDASSGDDESEGPKPPSYGELVESWGGLTPLLHAVRQGHVEASLALLKRGADINQPSAGDLTTPLFMATVNGHFDLALLLLDKGADPNLASTAGTTPLFAVLERTWAPKSSYSHPVENQQQIATHIDVIEALLEAGADPNTRLSRDLWYTEYTFSVLRRAGIHFNGTTPFWRAAQALDVDAMRLLQDHGANPDTPSIKLPERQRQEEDDTEEEEDDAFGSSGAETASEKSGPSDDNGDEDGSDEAGDQEAKDEEEDKSGLPPIPVGGPFIYPIHLVAGAGYGQAFAGNAHRHVPGKWLAALKYVVEDLGADVNLRDANGYTALHHAASRGDDEMIRYLMAQGADITVVSRKGQTVADMANGPIERVPPFPTTIALLEALGSENSNNCVSC